MPVILGFAVYHVRSPTAPILPKFGTVLQAELAPKFRQMEYRSQQTSYAYHGRLSRGTHLTPYIHLFVAVRRTRCWFHRQHFGRYSLIYRCQQRRRQSRLNRRRHRLGLGRTNMPIMPWLAYGGPCVSDPLPSATEIVVFADYFCVRRRSLSDLTRVEDSGN